MIKLKTYLLFVALLLSVSQQSFAQVIHKERSLYRNIFVEDKGDLRCLKFSLKRRTSQQSCINKAQPKQLVFKYYQLLMASLVLLDEPKNILIIGLGGGTMSNTLHQLFPKANITNVEIDKAVQKVARRYFNFIENEHVSSVVQDGRIFIKREKIKNNQYDLVILDAFNGDYIPEHLMTKEFLNEVKSILSANGVVAANTFSNSKLFWHESATYHAVFNEFYIVSFNTNTNRIILANNKQLPDIAALKKQAKKWQNKLQAYDVNMNSLMNYIKKAKAPEKDIEILTDQYSPANLLK